MNVQFTNDRWSNKKYWNIVNSFRIKNMNGSFSFSYLWFITKTMVKIRIFCFFNFVFLWILGIGAQQMSPFYGYQTNNGIRESLLAINAFCGMWKTLYSINLLIKNNNQFIIKKNRSNLFTFNGICSDKSMFLQFCQSKWIDNTNFACMYGQYGLYNPLFPGIFMKQWFLKNKSNYYLFRIRWHY